MAFNGFIYSSLSCLFACFCHSFNCFHWKCHIHWNGNGTTDPQRNADTIVFINCFSFPLIKLCIERGRRHHTITNYTMFLCAITTRLLSLSSHCQRKFAQNFLIAQFEWAAKCYHTRLRYSFYCCVTSADINMIKCLDEHSGGILFVRNVNGYHFSII